MQIRLNPTHLSLCRNRLNLTQQEAANLIGVSQPAYQRYEAGSRNPSIQVVRQIAAGFHTSVDYLTGSAIKEEPDFIIIDKKSDPQLFALVERFHESNWEMLARVSEYLDKLEALGLGEVQNKAPSLLDRHEDR